MGAQGNPGSTENREADAIDRPNRAIRHPQRGTALLTIVDLGLSNLASVLHAFTRIGVDAAASRDPDLVTHAPGVVLPGVGAFGDGMRALAEHGLGDALRARAAAGRPTLGICLGMQLLAEAGTESDAQPGLGLVGGTVVRLDPPDPAARVPNVGWCDTTARGDDGPVPGGGGCFYYVHGYHLDGPPEEVAATTDVGGRTVTSAVARGAVWGVQFHPEKSQDDGLEVLQRFVARVAGAE